MLTAFLITINADAQKITFNDMMKSALHMHDTASTWPAEKAVADYYGKVIKEYPDEWLSAYWATYIYTQLANSLGRADGSPDNVKKADLLDEAQRTQDVAMKRYQGDSAEIKSDLYIMQSFIYYFRNVYGEEEEKESWIAKADEEMKKALQFNSYNPLAYVLMGTSMVRSDNFKEVIAGRLLLQKAKALFADVDEHRALTTQWNEEWLRFFWLGHADNMVKKTLFGE